MWGRGPASERRKYRAVVFHLIDPSRPDLDVGTRVGAVTERLAEVLVGLAGPDPDPTAWDAYMCARSGEDSRGGRPETCPGLVLLGASYPLWPGMPDLTVPGPDGFDTDVVARTATRRAAYELDTGPDDLVAVITSRYADTPGWCAEHATRHSHSLTLPDRHGCGACVTAAEATGLTVSVQVLPTVYTGFVDFTWPVGPFAGIGPPEHVRETCPDLDPERAAQIDAQEWRARAALDPMLSPFERDTLGLLADAADAWREHGGL